MDEESFKRFREERIVFHGLRKNAVINLLEVGCTENRSDRSATCLGRWFSTTGGRSL